MKIRFLSVVEIGLKQYGPGDTDDVHDDTARSLCELNVAREVVEPLPREEMVQVTALPTAPEQVSGTLPSPRRKRTGGLLSRLKS